MLLCSLLHQSINTWTDLLAPVVPPADQVLNQWLGLGLQVVVAAGLVIVFGCRAAKPRAGRIRRTSGRA